MNICGMELINFITVRVGGFLWWGGMEKKYVSLDDFNELQRECHSLRKEIAWYHEGMPDLECILRVANLADKGNEHDRYHYVASWLRRISTIKREW